MTPKRRGLVLIAVLVGVLVLSMSQPRNERVLVLESIKGFQVAATERLAPDGETFTLTQLTGAYTDVDEDPDSHDGNYLNATGNNVNTAVLASFPTPTGNPTVGADLQEFRVRVHQYDEGQTGTPQARIELWENGVLVRAGTDTDVTTGGVILSFTWNANELGTADGSLVECYVYGTKSGGSPSARNSVEVDAIEWNVDYSTGGTAYDVTIYELIEISDSTATAMNLSTTVYEEIPLYDSISTTMNLSLTVLESLLLYDSIDTAVSFFVSILEVIDLFDSVTAVIGGGGVDYYIVINEILPFSDTINTIWSAFIGISEILPFDETINTTWNATLQISEIIDLFDSVTAVINPAITVLINVIIPIGVHPIVEGGLESLDIFYDLFLSGNMWSYLGPISLVLCGYFLVRKDKVLGVLWFLIECLFVSNYFTLVEAHPDYWWHIFILLVGGVLTCVFPLADR